MKVYNTRCVLVDINGETEKLQCAQKLKTRILKNMQIIVNARGKNTKHIPEGALMNLAKYKFYIPAPK